MNLSTYHNNTTDSLELYRSLRELTTPIMVSELGLVNYKPTWEYQRSLVRHRASTLAGPDRLLLLEHHPVFTAGKRTQPNDLPVHPIIPVINVDRGGKITWHGPGQLIGYPIIKLAEPLDVVRFVRRIEQAIIATCRDFNLQPVCIAGQSGVWIESNNNQPHRKIAAIGIRIAQGVSHHGFAINCNNILDYFDTIVPCGITNAGVTTLSAETGRNITVADVIPVISRYMQPALDGTLTTTVLTIEDKNIPTKNGV